MAYENEQTGGLQQGAAAGNGGAGTTRVRDHLKAASAAASEHLRAASTAAGDAARQRREQATQWARSRGTQAGEWARGQFSGLQGRVESDPAGATMWALGIGLVVGVMLSALVRGGRNESLE